MSEQKIDNKYNMKCDVCGYQGNDCKICCSLIAPVSFCKCQYCYEHELEPYVFLIYCWYVNPRTGEYYDSQSNSIIKMMHRTRERLGISENDFILDLEKISDDIKTGKV